MAVIGILAALLLPALTAAKRRGLQIQCVNNARQLTAAGLMYMHDTGQNIRYNDPQIPGYDPSWPITLWMGALSNYIATAQLQMCPVTHRQSPLQANNLPGTADIAWDFGYWCVPPITGSYGFNLWLFSYTPAPTVGRAGTFPSYLFGTPNSIQRPSLTPMFFDSIWDIMQPLESDLPANNLYSGYSLNSGMGVCTIMRHGGRTAGGSYPFSGQIGALPGAINIGFCDGHAQLVNLRDLWGQYWHYNWRPP
jgi:prepilin-type processing-associated H-X9-DG protein